MSHCRQFIRLRQKILVEQENRLFVGLPKTGKMSLIKNYIKKRKITKKL